jgi:CRISPR-associated protein Cmr2
MAIELGPVVQIVTAARKTRDLWFGSHMLSQIAKSVAKAVAFECESVFSYGLQNIHRHLIAPAPQSVADLEDNSAFVMGDEILVLLPTGVDPASVAQKARHAAHQKWLDLAKDAFGRVSHLLEHNVWDQQTKGDLIGDSCGEVIEVYCAWVSLPKEPTKDQYQSCLKRVKWLMEGRTACRNFPAGLGNDEGSPKSSLDGRRRSVLAPNAQGQTTVHNKRLRLSRGEQLDAMGVTKRVWGGLKNYPSTARLAADPWVRGADCIAKSELAALRTECEKLANEHGSIDPVLGQIKAYAKFQAFPYEGAVLFATRHHEFLEEANEQDQKILAPMKSALRKVISRVGEPGAYYAILMADGDNVGLALKQCDGAEDHREFSSRLSQFAVSVRGIVEEHQGAVIYAAGEDIVALLPLDHCIGCANELRTRFRVMFRDRSVSDRPMTLSVGITIGHFLDALEDVQASAWRMLDNRAKQFHGKNALAIQYRSRGGAPIECVMGWEPKNATGSDDATASALGPHDQIQTWARLLRTGDLPAKIAYDVRRLAESYRRWPMRAEDTGVDPSGLAVSKLEEQLRTRAMVADLGRLMSSKRPTARTVVEPLLRVVQSPDDVINLANTIIISGLIAQSQKLSQTPPGQETNQ